MDLAMLKQQWLAEEQAAAMKGWDFSHLEGRMTQDPPPWDYATVARQLFADGARVLDLDTGGGELLLQLAPDPSLAAATENYPPNAELCRQKLPYLGVDFVQTASDGPLPWRAETFDAVLCRHGSYDPREVWRVLKPGGFFLTQQVGEHNDRAFVDLLLPDTPLPYPGWNLKTALEQLKQALFLPRLQAEAYSPMTFTDVGALVWFAKVIPWEFPGFSVEACLDRLTEAQTLLEQKGVLSGETHRFMVLAQKPPEPGFLNVRPATKADADAILSVYHACADWGSVLQNSTWNREYPAMEEIEADLSLDGLFVMTCQKEIIAAISLIPHDDLDQLECWSHVPACVPVRLAVHPRWQRNPSRIAERMMQYVFTVARDRGYKSLRFLAAENNVPACRLYDLLQCARKGRTNMYGHDFICFEKLL